VQRTTAVTLTLAAFLAGCSAPDTMMSDVALPARDTAAEPSGPPGTTGQPQPNALMVNGRQRGYLDALAAGGVHPSSELLALSIGSYVCQARAAKQSPQAVWDYVHPLVSSDVHDAQLSSAAPTSADVDVTTTSYIRIASDRLC
jgi:hypothetical protein